MWLSWLWSLTPHLELWINFQICKETLSNGHVVSTKWGLLTWASQFVLLPPWVSLEPAGSLRSSWSGWAGRHQTCSPAYRTFYEEMVEMSADTWVQQELSHTSRRLRTRYSLEEHKRAFTESGVVVPSMGSRSKSWTGRRRWAVKVEERRDRRVDGVHVELGQQQPPLLTHGDVPPCPVWRISASYDNMNTDDHTPVVFIM